MARRQDQGVLRQLHTVLNLGAIRELTDGQLLERFATAPREVSELAFAVLVERHGPMVLRVCQGVLAEPHDRQDAFQATFLVLVRRASALWVRDSLGPWLHQVAYRTACHARAATARRRWHERRAAELTKEALNEVDTEPERLLHEEIHRLPERYRVPIVLCDLGGRTHEQAARHLGWPVGTVKSRLARGRERLRDRLRRRGVDAKCSLLAAALRPGGADTAVPRALAEATTRAAIETLMGRTILAGSAAALTTGVLRTMSAIHGLKVAVLLLAVAAATTGAPLLAQRGRRRAPAAPTTPDAAAGQDARDPQTLVVKPGRVNGSLVTQGQLRSAGVVDVFSSAEGQATILFLVPDRTVVKEGQLVCELDSSALRQQLLNEEIATKGAEAAYQNAKLAREVAETALTEYVEGVFQQKQIVAQGEVTTAQDELRMAENRLGRTQRAKRRLNDLLGPKVGPKTPADIVAELEIEDRLEAAQAAVKREKLAVERAENARKVLERFTRDKAVKELNADIEKARSEESTRKGIWELEQRKEQKLRTQIANCKLLAPREGLVLHATEPGRALGGGMGGFGSGMGGFGGAMGGLGGGMAGLVGGRGGVRPIQEGETVHERQKLFSIPTGPFTLTFAASKAVADRLAVGNSARITANGMPDEALHGTVEKISAFARTPPAPRKGRAGAPGQLGPGMGRGGGPGQLGPAIGNGYVIAVKIDKPPPALAPGLFAQAEIFANERDDILTVPNESIVRTARDGERVVVKKPDGTFELRAVTLGAVNDTMTEILQGLEKGESIVLDPANVNDEELRQEISRLQPQFQ